MKNTPIYPFSVKPSEYPYREGALYLGGAWGHDLGILTKRHAITVAGSRTGKGVGVIIPNLLRWKSNVIVIDPKGEAANATWKARQEMGQAVHVLDPFRNANKVPESVRASYNPLSDLDPESPSLREDIGVIADGLVMRTNSDAEHWDNGTMRLLSGLIAFVLLKLPPEEQNLLSVRDILTDQREGGMLDSVVAEMAEAEGRGGCNALMRAGAAAKMAKEGDFFVSNALKHTDWLDSERIADVMSHSTFSMRDIKRGKASIFIALPFKYLPQQQHGRFLRLLVRCGIGAMQEPMPDGSDTGEKFELPPEIRTLT